MNVLSLFDGMSCGQIALNRVGIIPTTYYASEIDKYAIIVTQKNFPNTIQLGDINNWMDWNIDWTKVNLVTGGFPCQAWSMAGKQLGDRDDRGRLFWTMLDIMKKVVDSNPDAKFLIENVKMKKEFEEYITEHTESALGKVNKYKINSSLVSAQNRNRCYWSNIDATVPLERDITAKDVLENYSDGIAFRATVQRNAEHTFDGKIPTITASMGMGGGYIPLYASLDIINKYKGKYINSDDRKNFSKLTPLECERLQNVPDNYTKYVSNSQRYKMLGNGWTIDVIAHIFKGIKNELI